MADEMRRLSAAVLAATQHISPDVDAAQLFLDAAAVSEARLPGPLGVAVAGVLTIEAALRRAHGKYGTYGAQRSMVALALAVLETDLIPDAPPDGPPEEAPAG